MEERTLNLEELKAYVDHKHTLFQQSAYDPSALSDSSDDRLEQTLTAVGRHIAAHIEERVGFEHNPDQNNANYQSDLTRINKEVLAKLRPTGAVLNLDDEVPELLRKNLQKAVADHLPTDWVQASNDLHDNIHVGLAVPRPHYVHERHTGEPTKKYSHHVRTRQITRYGLLPLADKNRLHELLGDNARFLPARNVVLDGEEYLAVEVPVGTYFPSNPGNGVFRYYLEPETGRLSDKPTWVVEVGLTDSVVRPEMLLPAGIDSENQQASYFHEFGHRIEAVLPNRIVMRMEEAFLRRRTTIDGIREPLTPIYPEQVTSNPFSTEWGRKGDLPFHYVGKEYFASEYREVFAVGLEAVFTGSHGGLSGVNTYLPADSDFKAFILGCLALL